MSALKDWLAARTSKATPVDADEIYLRDSVSGDSRRLTWSNVKATLKTYFDGLYQPLSGILDLWANIQPDEKQDTLVSGSSIKTINSTSLLGPGNIATGPVPAGTGSELQYRSGSGTVGAVTGSSVSGSSVTLTGNMTFSSPADSIFINAGPARFQGYGSAQLESEFFSTCVYVQAGYAQVDNGTRSTLRQFRAGTYCTAVVAKAADYTLTVYEGTCTMDASGGARTVTLPTLASSTAGQQHIVIKTDSSINAVSVDADGTETINGSTSAVSTMTQWGIVRVMVNADKSGWITW